MKNPRPPRNRNDYRRVGMLRIVNADRQGHQVIFFKDKLDTDILTAVELGFTRSPRTREGFAIAYHADSTPAIEAWFDELGYVRHEPSAGIRRGLPPVRIN